jgi:hypothetical protein
MKLENSFIRIEKTVEKSKKLKKPKSTKFGSDCP